MFGAIGDWFKRHWALLSMALVALVSSVVFLLVPKKSRKTQLKEFKDSVERLKNSRDKELSTADNQHSDSITELDHIEKIDDDDERLRRLARFANRGKT